MKNNTREWIYLNIYKSEPKNYWKLIYGKETNILELPIGK